MAVAGIIQKACRGYLDRKKILSARNHQKMNLHFQYFEKVKYKMEFDAVIKIVYNMKKYARKKIRRREELAAKKAAAKGKKKNSFQRKATM